MQYKRVFLPFAPALALLIVHLFTGIVFTYSADNEPRQKPLLLVIWLVEFPYLCSSAVIERYYNRKRMKIRFLRVTSMIVSVALASSTQF